jgi:hypothetical protein
MRYNLYRSRPDQRQRRPGFSSAQAMQALEEVFAETMPRRWVFDYMGMSFQEKKAQKGVSPMVIFAFSLLCVFLILAAQYESWSAVLGPPRHPIAVAGAFVGLLLRVPGEQRLCPDRSGHADRPGGQERHPDRRVRQDGNTRRANRWWRPPWRGRACACGPSS